MRIGTGLVEEQVAIREAPQDRRDPLEERSCLVRPVPPGPGRIVLDPVQAELADDVAGAIAVVLVEIEDADPAHPLLLAQDPRRHHKAIERAETVALVVSGMVETRDWRHGAAVFQGKPGCTEHCPAGPWQAGRHFRQVVAEAVGLPQGQHSTDISGIVGQAQLFDRHRYRRNHLEHGKPPPPRGHHFAWLARTRRKGLRVGHHALVVDDFHAPSGGISSWSIRSNGYIGSPRSSFWTG